MAKHTLLSWREKWVALTGRFRDNSAFEIAEDDYRELSADIGDTFFQPIDELLTRIGKLENPAPDPVEGVRWITAPKVTLTGATGTDVTVTACEGEFDGVGKTYLAGVVHQAPKPQDGTTRVDILASTPTGWYYIYGEEGGVTPPFVHATDPTIKLLFAAYLVWTSAGATVEEPVSSYVRYENGNLIAPDGSTIQVGAKTLPYEPFATTGAVTVDFTKSPNWKGPAANTTSITVATKADGKSTIPDGGDLRALLEGCAGQTINLTTGNVDYFTGQPLTKITLPTSGNCLILVNNVSGVLRWSWSDGDAASPIESTDQLPEGTNNLYFTEARALLSKLTGYVKQGTTRALAATDSLLMALGIIENRLDTLDSGKEKKIPAQSTAPASPATGDKYIDTSVSPNVLRRWDGAAWVAVGAASGSSYTPPIPYTRTAQAGTVINFSQSKDQYLALTANLVISDITNPVQGEEIVLEIDGRGNSFVFSITSTSDTVRVINASSYVAGKINYVGLRCVSAATNTYIANYIS